ncbi:DNA ligase [Polaromonas sp. JS666]|uniref:DNA ligase n=1 Tax=Polaromonas sp. (strain JS666 / ATCC BAA-500) TaxID=296591 RepID=UPI0000464139|nr:DNA ligase [Polaromonas sp. JS666]ABE44335.1 ATP dependent DNA ligase [Polaromonas sp. JS666]
MPAHTPSANTRLTIAPFRAQTLALLLALAGLLTPALPLLAAETSPPLMLAKVYHVGVSLADYWVSEKYDGVRGYWDGEKLLTRGGERIVAPAWFTADWPKVAMDGELWAGRGQFAKAVSTVRQQTPDDAAWRAMRFMVFDLPAQGGPFTERIPALNGVVSRIDQPWVQAVAQFKVANHRALQNLLATTEKHAGEGLMLHRGASLYMGQRTDDLLKVKTHEDTEARVVAHIPGKGKYVGVLGALLVEMPGVDGKPGRRFKLGSGFNDEQRQNPPVLGSTVTYRFRGLNGSGVPRFASFMRVREDQPV